MAYTKANYKCGSLRQEILSVSGILKIIETVLLFIVIIIHRHGDHGKYIFFGTSEIHLKAVNEYNVQDDEGIDAENLGNGSVVTFLIISPVLLICYALDGREIIIDTSMEWAWNFLGFVLLGATGVVSLITWSKAKMLDKMNNSDVENTAFNYDSALAMSSLCVIAALVYFVDFIVALLFKRAMK